MKDIHYVSLNAVISLSLNAGSVFVYPSHVLSLLKLNLNCGTVFMHLLDHVFFGG